MATDVQKALSDEITKYQQLEKDKQKVIGLIKQLDAQLNENASVKEVCRQYVVNLVILLITS